MDTPNLPENETEEITWQDDENRATLFLRSVFVVLSGALIVSTQHIISFYQGALGTLYLLAMNIVLPICIIWFFFGQGLRPVEWLSDQKYNAWNYGLNFKDWKTHLKWSALLVFLIFLMLTFHSIQINCNYGYLPTSHQWLLYIVNWWFMAALLIWLFWGYIWFGCAQGFGAIVATIVVTIGSVLLLYSVPEFAVYAAIISLLNGYICWKTRSFAPVLYACLISAPMLILITWRIW